MKIFHTQTFRRGQVWMVYEPDIVSKAKKQCGDRGRCNTRPYLIVSANEELESFNIDPIIMCIPITSSDSYHKPDDIHIYNTKGEKNKIELEIHPMDEKFFRNYLFSASDELMDEIDQKLSRKLGLSNKIMKNGNDKPLVNESLIEPHKYIGNKKILESVKPYPYYAKEISIGKIGDSITDKDKKEERAVKRNGRKTVWSYEKAREFLADCETLPPSDIMLKYSLSNKADISKRRYYCKKKVRE